MLLFKTRTGVIGHVGHSHCGSTLACPYICVCDSKSCSLFEPVELRLLTWNLQTKQCLTVFSCHMSFESAHFSNLNHPGWTHLPPSAWEWFHRMLAKYKKLHSWKAVHDHDALCFDLISRQRIESNPNPNLISNHLP